MKMQAQTAACSLLWIFCLIMQGMLCHQTVFVGFNSLLSKGAKGCVM